ncbi:MAG: YggS family pyridoxal phosphate-dependent enzyme [Bdellovibrionales bacterium]|nr:YggS family pyridoxal phosphate-dependent enzyme [Bdellovibrionales bacterium]
MSELEGVLERIQRACLRASRRPADVNLLPVSKGQDLDSIRAFLGQARAPQRLGENYLEELVSKRTALGSAVEWHYLGRLQSRKVLDLCASVDVIHTVSRDKEIKLLAEAPRCPDFFIQVNVSGEAQKNGCSPAALPPLLESIEALGLTKRVRGLMALPASLEEIGETSLRKEFGCLRELRDRLLPGKALSMGMSADFELAIAEGADWIRLGTILFGQRKRQR